MNWRSLFRKPALWSHLLAGCLIAVLALAAAGAFAQSGGDPPGATPAAVPPQEEAASGEPAGDLSPGLPPSGSEAAPDTPAGADGEMFSTAPTAPQQTAAAVSTQITYQGVLEDDGQPADGLFDMRFRLFDADAAGAQLGEYIASDVSVQDGQFTALLDFGPDVFAGQALWLEIAVQPPDDPGFETLSPRQPVTPAPVALTLPNVSTDPANGYVTIGDGNRLSNFEHFGINAEYDGWVGMYITGGGSAARPYYGYATDDEGSFDYAWTEYNGSAGEWQLYIQEAKILTVNGDGDVHASGDFSQPAAADGLVKAAAYVECWPNPSFVQVYNSFNTVTGGAVTAATGPDLGQCYVDFGFDLSNRFYNATAVQTAGFRGVTCDVDTDNTNRLHCTRWIPNDAGAQGWGGRIMVVVY